jgi:hypothetical protein
MTYEIVENDFGVQFIVCTDQDGKVFWIPTDPANSDYQTYLKSLEEVTNEPR